ncbi:MULTISPECIES: hydroxyacylglutathione hydrolase [Hydrocarboniphaga]|jgi:hydroxyacylglutathione hydrolase|uniref:Hydroxyacylglutathione hydrolase n=1 Tax=Hydrocarboniphaga effusa AP103 TaxID=1172194 RepID=I7Z7J9_9GAMM|nr:MULTISPECIES: hydroxyacylglutathione hydrolase [Hydrocarboniphaga]EIT67572.1 hydroxyacylglutathione hydrolase [Hydrocarboniphaga effusa AP103]MDZ4080158.1 hydroxyacylglutathione hydrolase [Hydrocarboniphaga sp.]
MSTPAIEITPIEITPIPAFNDNYIWLLARGSRAVVVDPGDAAPVIAELDRRRLALDAVIVTHHHGDHVGGIAQLLERRAVPVYGPQAEQPRIGTLTHLLNDGDRIEVLGHRAEVIAVPGHTLGHIAYHFADLGALFCGDTLFYGGCGRLFEGTPEQMHASLSRLAALPERTAVYCAHEYTLSNLAFALAVESENSDIASAIREAQDLRRHNRPTLPSTIGRERRVNPFLRSARPGIADHAPEPPGSGDPVQVFASLRRWKDHFRPPGEL